MYVMVMILEKEEQSMVIASTLVMQGEGASIPKVMSTVIIREYSEQKQSPRSVLKIIFTILLIFLFPGKHSRWGPSVSVRIPKKSLGTAIL